MKVSAKTDIGRIRKQNQDYYAYGILDAGITWAVVCDGMGGAAGGYVASSTACRFIEEKLNACLREGMSENSVKNIIQSVIEGANILVFDKSEAEDELAGMGTTCVLAVVCSDTLYVANVGDSRAYRVNSGTIEQLSKDHSVVQQMVDDGRITKEQARIHPDRNIITRALGVSRFVNIDFFRFDYNEGDRILLCSDGLYGCCSDEAMCEIACSCEQDCAEKLVELANSNGGSDNITAVIISE